MDGRTSRIDLHRELRRHLRLSLRLASKIGNDLETGEEFRVRMTVANTAPDVAPDAACIHFRNARIVVCQSPHARPVRGATLWLDLPESYLRPGDASSVEVDLVARQPLAGLFDFVGGLERVVAAWATADLDLDAFFKLWVAPHERVAERDGGTC